MIFFLIGFSTIWLFMYKITWLFNTKTFIIYFIYCIILSIISIVLIQNKWFDYKTVKALQIPLISAIVFFILYRLFKKIYKRDPENTFWAFTKKPIEDVVFSLLFWFLGAGLPVILITL